jgi:hypothetical protein
MVRDMSLVVGAKCLRIYNVLGDRHRSVLSVGRHIITSSANFDNFFMINSQTSLKRLMHDSRLVQPSTCF